MKASSHEKNDLTSNDIAEFLKPLIEKWKCDVISLNRLRGNHKELVSKLKETGRPAILIIDGQPLLLSDARIYFDLEERRECLTSRFKTVEDAIQLGKIDFASSRIVDLDIAQREVTELEEAIKSSKWNLNRAVEKLPQARERLAKITAEMPVEGK